MSFSMSASLALKLSKALSALATPLSSVYSKYRKGERKVKRDGTVLVVKLLTMAKAPRN